MFGRENNQYFDCFRYAMFIITQLFALYNMYMRLFLYRCFNRYILWFSPYIGPCGQMKIL